MTSSIMDEVVVGPMSSLVSVCEGLSISVVSRLEEVGSDYGGSTNLSSVKIGGCGAHRIAIRLSSALISCHLDSTKPR